MIFEKFEIALVLLAQFDYYYKSLAWKLWFNTNTWIVLLMKLKVLSLITLVNYITNHVTSILLIIFCYCLLAPITNLWKRTHLDRNVPVPLEQSLFYQMHTLITGQRSILAQKGTFSKKKNTFFEKRAPKISPPPIQSLL